MPIPQFLTGLGLSTKIGLGVATAAAAVGGVGVAGALPGPAQATFDTVAPFETDEVADDVTEGEEEGDPTSTTTTTLPGDESTDTDDPELDGEGDELDAPTTTNFGAIVSEMARAGEADGRIISEMAHLKNEARKAAKAGDDTDDTDDDDDATDASAASAGSGKSAGKGRGPNR